MLINSIKKILLRDLNLLRNEIELFQNEENLWITEGNITNSAGNLCLHIIGNLNTYIGKALGNTDYVRHRDLEFSLKYVPKTELLQKIEDTILVVKNTLENFPEENLQNKFPIYISEENETIEFYLVHLVGHLRYHLGQINYHRRLLDF